MPQITGEQIKNFIQAIADDYNGIAEQSLGNIHDDPAHGNGWRGEYGNMMMSIVRGVAHAINQTGQVTEETFTLNDPIAHNLGRLPLFQIYDNSGILLRNSQVEADETIITVTSGPTHGTIVYM